MGKVASTLLFEQIKNKKYSTENQTKILDPSLIVRSSSKF